MSGPLFPIGVFTRQAVKIHSEFLNFRIATLTYEDILCACNQPRKVEICKHTNNLPIIILFAKEQIDKCSSLFFIEV